MQSLGKSGKELAAVSKELLRHTTNEWIFLRKKTATLEVAKMRYQPSTRTGARVGMRQGFKLYKGSIKSPKKACGPISTVASRNLANNVHHDLKGKALRGGVAKLCGQAVNFALRLGFLMVLARLLSPRDFGLVAMVTMVTGVYGLFTSAALRPLRFKGPRLPMSRFRRCSGSISWSGSRWPFSVS